MVANIFGAKMETPQEAQQRMLEEIAMGSRQFQGDPNAQFGYNLANAISASFGGRRKQLKDADERAKASEVGAKVREAHLSGGGNPMDAEMAARAAAAAHIRALGGTENVALANQIRDNMTQLQLQKEQRDLEIQKNKAQIKAAEGTAAVRERELFEAKGIEELESFLAKPDIEPGMKQRAEDRLVELERNRAIQNEDRERKDEELELRRAQLEEQKRAREFKETRLSPRVEDVLLRRQDSAFKSAAAAQELEALANTVEQELVAGGVAAITAEKSKQLFGTEDPTTLLRTRANQIRISQAIDNLPPGVASDKDIELVLSGTIPSTANPKSLAAYLRGLAKMERYNESFNKFSVRYIGDQALKQVANPTVGMIEAWNAGPSEEAYGLINQSISGIAPGTTDQADQPFTDGSGPLAPRSPGQDIIDNL
jgi:hypothetical protein